MEEYQTIGQRIKHWRKEKGITQDTLAKRANVPYTTIAKIESGVIKNPSIQTVTKISEGLDVSLDELIKGEKC